MSDESERCGADYWGARERGSKASAFDRCTLNAGHEGDHRWHNGNQLRYAEGFDVVLVPDPAADWWKDNEGPIPAEVIAAADASLAKSRAFVIARDAADTAPTPGAPR